VVETYRRLYGSQAWRRLSRAVLEAAGYRCQMTEGCPNIATCADHIVPALELAEHGRLDLFFAPENVRASCRSCNSSHGARLGNSRRRERRAMSAYEQAIERGLAWAERENAYWREVEARAQRPAPMPRIY
jgi:hypothetical protein